MSFTKPQSGDIRPNINIAYQPDTISLRLELFNNNTPAKSIHQEVLRNPYYNATGRGAANFKAAFQPFIDQSVVISKAVLQITARRDSTFSYFDLDSPLKGIENKLKPISITFFAGNNTAVGTEFIGYETYLKFMIQENENELLIKETLLNTARQSRPDNYVITQAFTEELEGLSDQFGSSTLSHRLEHIQNITS